MHNFFIHNIIQTKNIMYGSKSKVVARLGRQVLAGILFAGIAMVSIPAMASSISNGEAAPVSQSSQINGKQVYTTVDKAPEFPGGNAALMRWLGANIRYPISAQMDGIQGKVVVRFVVNEDGSVSNIQIVEKIEGSLDREAWRLVRSMPKWQAGEVGGRKVATYVNLPIIFRLTEPDPEPQDSIAGN